jgi:DNA-binding response OmpR family regulator
LFQPVNQPNIALKKNYVKKILIVEDNTVLQQLFHNWFETKKVELLSLHTAYHLAQRIESFRPDLIITDILLPDTTAEDLIHCYANTHVPIIVMSAMDPDDLSFFSNEIHAVKAFKKPVNLMEVLTLAEDLISTQSNNNHHGK